MLADHWPCSGAHRPTSQDHWPITVDHWLLFLGIIGLLLWTTGLSLGEGEGSLAYFWGALPWGALAYYWGSLAYSGAHRPDNQPNSGRVSFRGWQGMVPAIPWNSLNCWEKLILFHIEPPALSVLKILQKGDEKMT